MVARLPLDGLAVARPVDQLRPPHVGYVMELFTGMVPLLSLMKPPKGTGGVTQWYLDGGGLGRRLRLLAHVAEAVAALHGRGLVYADLSPHNVFVSENRDDHEVRLIDIDNLHPATTTGRLVYTPRYGAPEVVRQTGSPSTLADAHAFAVLAFETLALAHPLLGDVVRDGEPELEERALRGELPWIEAPDDDRNRSSDGIPRELAVSPVLQQDFQRAFGPGLSNPGRQAGTDHLGRASSWRRGQNDRLSVLSRQLLRAPFCLPLVRDRPTRLHRSAGDSLGSWTVREGGGRQRQEEGGHRRDGGWEGARARSRGCLGEYSGSVDRTHYAWCVWQQAHIGT